MRVHPQLARSLRIVLVAVVMVYGALLRLDAISHEFEPVKAPRWLRHLEQARAGPSVLHPAATRWDFYPRFEHKDGPPSQYRSDPYTYLQYAREMRSFYAAHRREPLFPLATKIWLWLLHDDDTAVSFASAAFSVAAILLTFALGAELLGYWAGLGAALLWAIEFDAVTSSSEGWRDDAFTGAVLLTAWLLVRFARQATVRRGILLGIAAGAACLVRVTAVSFILPAFLWVIVAAGSGWKTRARGIGFAAAAMLVIAGPFFVNCWRVYGDPLYAINVHAGVYRATQGEAPGALSVRQYIGERLRSRPLATVDTFVIGLTRYPFANKWDGFDPWLPGLGGWLAAAALAGLFLAIGCAEGRLLLVVLAASLVPYALTWRLIADWRFTAHAYPFFLLAACAVPWFAVRAARDWRAWLEDRARARATAVAWGVGAVLVASGWFVFTRITPPRVFQDTVRGGEPATVMAGDRDASFFADGWPRVARTGTIATRVAAGGRATILLPLPEPADYDLLLRIDPSTEPLRPGATPQKIDVLLNGRLIGACDPGSTADRVGICRMWLPADGVRPGTNRLTVVTAQPTGFRVWYVRVTKRPA